MGDTREKLRLFRAYIDSFSGPDVQVVPVGLGEVRLLFKALEAIEAVVGKKSIETHGRGDHLEFRGNGPANDPHRVEWQGDQLIVTGRDDFREPICPVCDEPIRWCLDMMTFAPGYPHVLTHARCAWQPDAFDTQKNLAVKLVDRVQAWWDKRAQRGG